MANNILVKDANGVVRTVKSTEVAGVHVAHHVIDGITTVAGEVSIAGTVPVTGSVTVTNQPSSLTISNFPAFPTTQQVSLVAGSSINIGTMPSVTLANPVTSLSINNLPSVQNVSVNNWPSSQNVVITSMPQVAGHVTVSDGDGALTVDGAVSIVSLPDIAGAVEITNASLTVAGTVNVGNALTLNNSTNMIGRVELRVNGAEVEAGNALPVYVVNPGGGGGGGEVTIAAGQSVGITGNVTVQGTVGVAGEVDLGVDVVESAGLNALAVAITEGQVTIGNDANRELGKVTVTNTVPVTLSNTGPLPIQITNEAGDAVLGDSTPLNTKVTGGVEVKGMGGYLLSNGGGINLIGLDGFAPASGSNPVPFTLYDYAGNALGTDLPLKVMIEHTSANPIPVAIISGGSGGGEVTIADGQSVAIDGLVKLAGLDNTLPASGANPIPVYSDPSTPVVISTDSEQQGASIYALDGTSHQLLATRPVVISTTSGNPEYVGDTNPMPVTIVSGGSGGGSFDGQLTLGGNDVSTSNRLPVDIGAGGTVSLSGSVVIDTAMTNMTGLEVKLKHFNGQQVDQNSGAYVQPSQNAVFRVAPAPGSEGYFNVALLNPVEIQGTPTVNANIAAEYTNLSIGRATINGGATPVTLASASAKAVDILNHTSTDLEYRLGGAGDYMFLAAKSSDLIGPITNANQISIRRVDGSATAITVSYKVLS